MENFTKLSWLSETLPDNDLNIFKKETMLLTSIFSLFNYVSSLIIKFWVKFCRLQMLSFRQI